MEPDGSPTESEVVEKRQSLREILDRAREFNFLAAVFGAIWLVVSAWGALALRAYQSFGIGNAALLAVAVALAGIWGIPRIFERIRPRKPTLKEVIRSSIAGLLVLFVWTADKLPLLFQETVPAAPPSTPVSKEDFDTIRRERDQLKQQLTGAQTRTAALETQIANVAIRQQQPSFASSDQGPIVWGRIILQAGGRGSIRGMSFHGDCVSPVKIKEAYVASDLTSEQRQFMVLIPQPQNDEFVSLDQIREIPGWSVH